MESSISSIPGSILKQYQMIMLCVDIMYMNWNPMIVSISHNIKFSTVEAIQNNTPTTFGQVNQVYITNLQNLQIPSHNCLDGWAVWTSSRKTC